MPARATPPIAGSPNRPPAAAPEAAGLSLTGLHPKDLRALSSRHGWSLNESEMTAIQEYFRKLRREPTRAELETLAQTWSEHCKHKTMTGPIRYSEGKKTRLIKNLLAETVFKATKQLHRPWCLSAFKDNAGIVSFGSKWALAYKVETNNRPCAVEPYGGAETGVGSVVRDVMGAGLGAKPVLNTDVFCFAPPDYPGPLPENAQPPRRMLGDVVAGVRDYANRMGVPTAAGAIWFDPDYRLNPLVFCGTVGLLPAWAVRKEVKPGDVIVAAGGRTGRDGLHGATLSSAVTGAGQAPPPHTGHAINEKKLLDALLEAQQRKLYRSVTDCGAGGFSSAVGEIAAQCGAEVGLESARLKTPDMQPWEIWISESQERMLFAVPPRNLKAFLDVFASEDCETSVLGKFTGGGRLKVTHRGSPVVDLDMRFLHDGMPRTEKKAIWEQAKPAAAKPSTHKKSLAQILGECLAHLNVCSRESIIRQYDHEVQGGTVIKPLQGIRHDGPGDACVIWPHAATGDHDGHAGFAVSHGLNPAYGKLDPYRMALACADEALRNLLCVGADVTRASLLDNFCWGDPNDPAQLGALVRAAEGCRDAALGFGVPFISGKDSLHHRAADVSGKSLNIPGTLLISAIAPVPDVRKAVTMDIKGPGNALYLAGWTTDELGGSLFHELCGRCGSCQAPGADPRAAAAAFKAVHQAMAKGWVLSAHDLSEGGLGVCAAEMCFTGEFGAMLDLDEMPRRSNIYADDVLLFSETPSRLLLEVAPEQEPALVKALRGVPVKRVGTTVANPVLKVTGLDGRVALEASLCDLKSAWQAALPRRLG